MAGKFFKAGNLTYGRGTGRSGASWTMHQVGRGPQVWRVSGIDEMAKNINSVLKGMRLKSAAGLVAAANYVLTDADSGTPPLVPEDKGKLRTSRFATPMKTPGTHDPYVVLGYNANYAAAVHEMMQSPSGKPINWSRPGSGPKFLEASLKRNSDKVIAIVAKHME